jgi:hypothetical protein
MSQAIAIGSRKVMFQNAQMSGEQGGCGGVQAPLVKDNHPTVIHVSWNIVVMCSFFSY